MRATDENEQSSRSHLIFMIKIVRRPKDPKLGAPSTGKLSFIDLAGSESLAKIGVHASIYEEGLAINESLQRLGYVIRQLAKGKKKEEIDYDDHVLTKAMKDSLGGNAKTLMIVNISPSIFNVTQTRETLEFAKQTGKIQNQAGILITPNEISGKDPTAIKKEPA